VTTPAAHPPLAADELARHAAFLLRLARALVSGRDDADDLVQDAYVAALRHPPDADRPARPWFAQVVRNLVRMRRRGEARRRERDGAWQGERQDDERAAPTPDQLLDRALAHRALAEQVVLLAEPFRRTVLLRFVEGLETARIAELEGIAPATVRWRLKEGLERLRAGLDGSAGARGRWMRALAPAPLGGALSRVHLASRGVLIMKAKTKLALALVALVAAGGAIAVVVASAPAGDQAATGGADPRASAPGTAPRAAGARPTPAPAPAAAAAPEKRPLALIAARAELDPAAVRGSVEGRVVNWSTTAPVAGAEVVLSLADGASTSLATDGDGRFRFEPDRPGAVSIAAITAAGFLPFAPEWGHSPIELMARPGVRVRDVVIYLIPAIDYVGVVVAPSGEPVPGAEVRIIDLPAHEQELVSIQDHFTSDRKGEFHFHAPDYALLEARARGYGPGRTRLEQGAIVTHRLTVRLAADGGDTDALGRSRVSGVVVDSGGDPLPGVIVGAARPVRPTLGTPEELPAAGRAMSGADGGFTIDGLDPGDYELEARDGEHAPVRTVVTLQPRATARVRLTMSDGAHLAGTVRDTAGQPVPSFSVVVFESATLGHGRILATRTFVDRDGAFDVDGLEAREYRVQATAHGHAPSRPAAASAVLPPARPTAVDIQLPTGGTLVGVVRSKAGPVLENARITVEGGLGDGSSPVPFSASAVTDAQGAFTLRGLAPGRRSVDVEAYGHHGYVLTGLEVQDGAQVGPVEVKLTPLREGEKPGVELAGIGIAFSPGEDFIVVNQVVPGGGAEAAGIAAGDRIVSVDGRSVVEIGFEVAVESIRGPVGTTIHLGVRKVGDPSVVVDVLVQRVAIRL